MFCVYTIYILCVVLWYHALMNLISSFCRSFVSQFLISCYGGACFAGHENAMVWYEGVRPACRVELSTLRQGN
jgi:hypothetical protein